MDEKQRDLFINKIDWEKIFVTIPFSQDNLNVLSLVIVNLIHKYGEGVAQTPAGKRINTYIESHIEEIRTMILINHPTYLPALALFLSKIIILDPETAHQITDDHFMNNLVNWTSVKPRTFSVIANIINALRNIDPGKAHYFLSNRKLQKFIPEHFNSVEWHETAITDPVQYESQKQGARQLIKAIFRSSKDEWLHIRSRLAIKKKKKPS